MSHVLCRRILLVNVNTVEWAQPQHAPAPST